MRKSDKKLLIHETRKSKLLVTVKPEDLIFSEIFEIKDNNEKTYPARFYNLIGESGSGRSDLVVTKKENIYVARIDDLQHRFCSLQNEHAYIKIFCSSKVMESF